MNRRTTLFAVIVCSLFLLTACGTQSLSPTPKPTRPSATVETAEGLYQQSCINCHGGALQGGVGPSLQHIGSVLTKDQILSTIQHGKNAMPPQSQFSSEQQDKLAEWLSGKK